MRSHSASECKSWFDQQAKEKGYEVKTSVLPYLLLQKNWLTGNNWGFKLVAAIKILGVHVVAKNAGDIILAATLAVQFRLTVEDLRENFASYLTVAEGLNQAK